MNKSKASTRHAANRAMQRFGVTLGPQGNADIVRQIQRGQARFVDRRSNRVTRFIVSLPDGGEAVAVYDSLRKVVVTVYAVDSAGERAQTPR